MFRPAPAPGAQIFAVNCGPFRKNAMRCVSDRPVSVHQVGQRGLHGERALAQDAKADPKRRAGELERLRDSHPDDPHSSLTADNIIRAGTFPPPGDRNPHPADVLSLAPDLLRMPGPRGGET